MSLKIEMLSILYSDNTSITLFMTSQMIEPRGK